MNSGFLRRAAHTARAGLGLAGLADRLDRIDRHLAALAAAGTSHGAAFEFVTQQVPGGPAYELSIDASGRDEYHRAVADGRLNQEPTWCFLMDWLRPGETLFDLGANIGTFSIAAGVLGAEVHAFEMIGGNVAHLERSTHRNRLRAVTIVQCAVSDRRGLVGVAGTSAWGSVASDASVLVPALSIDDYVGLRPVADLHTIKIDIEGSEFRALKGAAATIARFRPDIVLESNTFQCGSHGYSYRDCLRLLTEMGYDLYRLHWGRLSPWSVDAVQEIAVVDYFATTKTREEVASRSGRTISPVTDDEVTANVIATADEGDTHRRHVLAVAGRLPESTASNRQVDDLLKQWQPLADSGEFHTMVVGNR